MLHLAANSESCSSRGRKPRRRAPLGGRALDLIQPDLHQTQRYLGHLVELGHELGQHRQIRVLTAGFERMQLLDALFAGGDVIFHAHGDTLSFFEQTKENPPNTV